LAFGDYDVIGVRGLLLVVEVEFKGFYRFEPLFGEHTLQKVFLLVGDEWPRVGG
jgi:hypothetical protein